MQIQLPTDLGRSVRLRAKLDEYERRINPYRAPELQMDTICKIAVLEAVLGTGEADTNALQEELSLRYGTSFSMRDFMRACQVVHDYCATGGANVVGGTGLLNA